MPKKKHRHNQIEQTGRHSAELKSLVMGKVFALTLYACVVLIVGLALLLIGLFSLFAEFTAHGLERMGNEWGLFMAAAIGLAVTILAVFMFRVLSAFRQFEPWSYPWIQFLFRPGLGIGNLIAYDDDQNAELLKAFNQPEYEYPEHPEYGPKLDEEVRPKVRRNED